LIGKIILAVPAAALTLLTFTAGMVASSDDAEACRRTGPGRYQIDCSTMSTPRPDRPNQQRR
jgi:hypothetical protein